MTVGLRRLAIVLAAIWVFVPEFSIFSGSLVLNVEALVVLLGLFGMPQVVAAYSNPRIHPSDRLIALDFLNFYDDNMRDFLRDQDVGGGIFPATFPDRIHQKRHEWRDSKWIFVDRNLEGLFNTVKLKISQVSADFAQNLDGTQNINFVRYLISDRERSMDFYDRETMARIEKSNALATELHQACERLFAELKRSYTDLFEQP